jgi:hypothetical protein
LLLLLFGLHDPLCGLAHICFWSWLGYLSRALFGSVAGSR